MSLGLKAMERAATLLGSTNAADFGAPKGRNWCGYFVAHCFGIPVDRMYSLVAARAWLRATHVSASLLTAHVSICKGESLALTAGLPKAGDVVVFHRGDPNSWTGHVGFCWSDVDPKKNSIMVLGGNQGRPGTVSLVRMSRSKLLGSVRIT